MSIYVTFEFLCAMIRLVFLKKTAGLSILGFAKKVFSLIALPSFLSIIVSYIVVSFVDTPLRFFVTISMSVLVVGLSTLLFGLCDDEKKVIMKICGKIINK